MSKLTIPQETESAKSSISKAIPYVDSVRVFGQKLTKRDRCWLLERCGSIKTEYQVGVGKYGTGRYWIHQPSLEALVFLTHRCRKLERVHFALDWITPAPEQLLQLALRHWDKPQKGKLQPYDDAKNLNCHYWSFDGNRSNVYVVYADKPSKITGEPCCHLELRVAGFQTLKRQYGISGIEDLILTDHEPIWRSRLCLRGIEKPAYARCFLKTRRRTSQDRDVRIASAVMRAHQINHWPTDSIYANRCFVGFDFKRAIYKINNSGFLPQPQLVAYSQDFLARTRAMVKANNPSINDATPTKTAINPFACRTKPDMLKPTLSTTLVRTKTVTITNYKSRATHIAGELLMLYRELPEVFTTAIWAADIHNRHCPALRCSMNYWRHRADNLPHQYWVHRMLFCEAGAAAQRLFLRATKGNNLSWFAQCRAFRTAMEFVVADADMFQGGLAPPYCHVHASQYPPALVREAEALHTYARRKAERVLGESRSKFIVEELAREMLTARKLPQDELLGRLTHWDDVYTATEKF